MSLSADLLALGEVLAPGPASPAMGFLDPRLRTVYSPRASWPPPERWEQVEAERDYSPWAGCSAEPEAERGAEPEAESLGSSIAPNPKRPPRHGLNGLPAAGRKQISRALALLEEMRPLLSFWTVTLPTESLSALCRAGTLPAFQDRLRKELARLLRRAGLPDLVVGVAELQPKRSRAEGRPCPHYHLVFQGRRTRGSGWALTREQLDGVIAAALTTAGVHASDLRSAGNVQQVKKSVRAYLAKYMTKGSGDCARWIGGVHEELIPRQWWFWTRSLRSWVLEHVFPLAYGFLAWVHEHRRGLEELGLLRWRVLPLSDPRAPVTLEVNWLRPEHVAQVVYLWQTDEWDAEWFRSSRLSLKWQP